MSGSKRPRRMAAIKQNKDDSTDPYIYTTAKITSTRARGQAQQQKIEKQKRGPKPGSTRGRQKQTPLTTKLLPEANLIAALKADISSDETGGRRRRAYTEMDDLLADDMKQKQNEQANSE